MTAKKYCFVHSCTFLHNGTGALDHLVDAINASGLIDALDAVFINNIGIPVDENKYTRKCSNEKYILTNYSENAQLYENPTLNKLKQFSTQNKGSHVLYLHTKGNSYPQMHQVITDWTNMMLYFLVETHDACFRALDGAYDTVGCNYSASPVRHYSGNFWWASTNYIATLPSLNECVPDKMAPEFWLFQNNPNACTLHSSGINHYHEAYPRKRYEPRPLVTTKTVCLNMIVKNESHVIVPTLENLCSHIRFDYWVICDTGSTDTTRELIREFFSLKNIAGELVQHEWVNFGHNRTKALECAFNKTDYVFVFDADDKICGSLNFDFLEDPDPKQACMDAYTFTIGTSFVYKRALLMNNRLKWQYRGVLHEYLAPLEPGRRMNDAHVPGKYHIESCRTGSRNMNPHKYVDDATVLKTAYEVEKDRDPGLAMRYVFYCAQSYKDAGPQYTDDAIAWYKRCLDLPMWAQEKYYSCLTLGFLSNQKQDKSIALKYFLRTVEYDAERIEGIVQAMEQMQSTGDHMFINALYHRFKGYNRAPQDKLFLFKHAYSDELEYNNSLSAYYAHDLPSGYECCKRIIFNRALPDNRLHQTVQNLKFYLSCAAQDTDSEVLRLFYAVDELIASNHGANQFSVWNLYNAHNLYV